MSLMKAVQVPGPGADFELVRKEIPDPQKDEVLIKGEVCGICHGDAIVKEGRYPNLQYPRIPGHEVVGTIAMTGPGVSFWKTGQRVGVGWFGGYCLACEACHKGEYFRCQRPLTTGISADGGYAEYMIARTETLVSIPDELASAAAAPLLCAGNTTFNALRESGAKPGDLVAIQGLGGLGHLGVQFSAKSGFTTAVISHSAEKEKLAFQLGTNYFFDCRKANPARELMKLGGASVILSTAPSGKAASELIDGLGPDGQLVIVQASPEPIPVFAFQLFQGKRSVKGWVGGDKESTIRFCVRHQVLPMIEVFPLEQAAAAYEKMIASKVHFRSVLKMEP
jgi:D-arabinose 1-dehydrogenase-like Zn-dependent alcohol dehydrogenase